MIITGDMHYDDPVGLWDILYVLFWVVFFHIRHAERGAGAYVPHHEVQLNMETKHERLAESP